MDFLTSKVLLIFLFSVADPFHRNARICRPSVRRESRIYRIGAVII